MGEVIHFIDKVLENLVPYIPLLQSTVWPLALLLLALLNRKLLTRALEVVVKRLESGSSMEIGSLKLGAMLVPSSTEESEKKKEEELSAPPEEPSGGSSPQPETTAHRPRLKPTVLSPDSYQRKQEMARHAQIENSALTKLSQEIGVPVIREVKPNRRSSLVFDGVAVDRQSFRIIEVRFLHNVHTVVNGIRRFLDSVSSYCLTLEEENRPFVSVILVLVLSKKFDGDSSGVQRVLSPIVRKYDYQIRVIQYKEKELVEDYQTQPAGSPDPPSSRR